MTVMVGTWQKNLFLESVYVPSGLHLQIKYVNKKLIIHLKFCNIDLKKITYITKFLLLL